MFLASLPTGNERYVMSALHRYLFWGICLLQLAGCIVPEAEPALTGTLIKPSSIGSLAVPDSQTPQVVGDTLLELETKTLPVSDSVVFDPSVLTTENIRYVNLKAVHGEGRIIDFALSPDGNKIAYITGTGIHLYDVVTGEKTLVEGAPDQFWSKPDWALSTLAFSPDGKELAAAYERNVVFFDLSETPRRNWKSPSLYVPNYGTGITHLAYSHDGKTILVLSDDLNYGLGRDAQIALFNRDQRMLVFTGMLSDNYFPAPYRFLSDGTIMLLVDSLGVVKVSQATGSVLEAYPLPEASIYGISFSEDGEQILVVKNHQMLHPELFNIEDWKLVRRFYDQLIHLPISEGFLRIDSENIKFLDDSFRSVCDISNSSVYWWNLRMNLRYAINQVAALDWDTNSIQLVETHGCETNLTLEIPTRSREDLPPIEPRTINLFPIWQPYTYEAEGKLLNFENNTIQICEKPSIILPVKNCTPKYRIEGYPWIHHFADLSKVILTNRWDHAMLDTQTGMVTHLQRYYSNSFGEDSQLINSATFSPDGSLFMITSGVLTSKTLLVWEVATGSLLLQTGLPNHAGEAYFSSDGRSIFVYADKTFYELGIP